MINPAPNMIFFDIVLMISIIDIENAYIVKPASEDIDRKKGLSSEFFCCAVIDAGALIKLGRIRVES
jgi:hypothetical protein